MRYWLALGPLLLAACAGGEMLKQGKAAPTLSAQADGAVKDIEGAAVEIKELASKGPVVLVFLRGFS